MDMPNYEVTGIDNNDLGTIIKGDALQLYLRELAHVKEYRDDIEEMSKESMKLAKDHETWESHAKRMISSMDAYNLLMQDSFLKNFKDILADVGTLRGSKETNKSVFLLEENNKKKVYAYLKPPVFAGNPAEQRLEIFPNPADEEEFKVLARLSQGYPQQKIISDILRIFYYPSKVHNDEDINGKIFLKRAILPIDHCINGYYAELCIAPVSGLPTVISTANEIFTQLGAEKINELLKIRPSYYDDANETSFVKNAKSAAYLQELSKAVGREIKFVEFL